jgi:hypothetical protein
VLKNLPIVRHNLYITSKNKPTISSANILHLRGKGWEKSPVVELLDDVVGAHTLEHLRKFRLGKITRKPVNASTIK